jgi:hypothetical protein
LYRTARRYLGKLGNGISSLSLLIVSFVRSRVVAYCVGIEQLRSVASREIANAHYKEASPLVINKYSYSSQRRGIPVTSTVQQLPTTAFKFLLAHRCADHVCRVTRPILCLQHYPLTTPLVSQSLLTGGKACAEICFHVRIPFEIQVCRR